MAKLNNEDYLLQGGSGKKHAFDVFSLDSIFEEIGGIYLFVAQVMRKGTYKDEIVIIDKTDNLSAVVNYDKNDFKPHKPDRILIKYVLSEEERDEILKDILDADYPTHYYKNYD